MDLRAKIDPNTVIMDELNTSLPPVDRSSKQNINKEITEIINLLDQMSMIGIYRVLHPVTIQ
jgi:hypothetical protein